MSNIDVTEANIGGKTVRKNDTYTVIDNSFLKNLTLSKTILHPNKHTNGHKHDGLDEIYFFKSGKGVIHLDNDEYNVQSGSIILIKEGIFHKVYNTSLTEDLVFICVFQAYER